MNGISLVQLILYTDSITGDELSVNSFGVLEKDPGLSTSWNEFIKNSNAEAERSVPSRMTLPLRLAGSILIDINEEGITGNRYLSVKSEMIFMDTSCTDFTAI